MNKVYTYTAVIYDGTHYEEDNYRLESGLLVADSYACAMDQLEDHYTPNLVRITDLTETDNDMIVLPADIVYNYARDEYDECSIPCDKWGTAESDSETVTDTKIDWNIQETIENATSI